MKIKTDIVNLLRDYPRLNYFGFGVFNERRKLASGQLTQEQRDKEIQTGQEELISKWKEVESVMTWLEGVDKIKTINRNHSSYGYKHMVEESDRSLYISNGAFIAGAILSGFDILIDEPNAAFNISERSIKEIQKKQK